MKKECIVMSITNQKGGVGITTTTVNLGIGLANEGHKVLMIDFDSQSDMTTCLDLTLPLKKLSYDTKTINKCKYYLNNDVRIIELEITNHSIQAVYHNDS